MHQELDADSLAHVRGKMSIRLVKRPWSLIAARRCKDSTNQTVPCLLIKDSDRTIVGLAFASSWELPTGYQVKAIGVPIWRRTTGVAPASDAAWALV